MPGLLLPDGRFMIWNIYNTYGVCLRITMICQASPGLLIFIQGAIAEELILDGKTGRRGITGMALLCDGRG